MRKKKSNLDEMQEKKLLNIEHNTLILTNVCLCAAILIQWAVWPADGHVIIGELAILLVSSFYQLAACIRNGIWDRSAKQPTMKAGILPSLIIGFVFSTACGVFSYVKYHAWQGSLALCALTFLATFILVLPVFSASVLFYRHRFRKLEQQADQDE